MNGESGEVDPSAAPAEPYLRIVSGNPTPEEIAALVTVVAAAAATGEPNIEETVDGWGSPGAMHRTPMPAPEPNAWNQLGRR